MGFPTTQCDVLAIHEVWEKHNIPALFWKWHVQVWGNRCIHDMGNSLQDNYTIIFLQK